MKKLIIFTMAVASFTAAQAQNKQTWPPPTSVETTPPQAQPPPAVYQAPRAVAAQPAPVQQPVYVYEQRLMAQQPVLYSPQQAQAIVDDYRTNYERMGKPRILIYVNRELVDENSGLKLSARSEKVETTRNVNTTGSATNASDRKESVTTKSTANNTYRDTNRTAPTLADRQTVRDVERLMGRPLRAAGAALVDQRVAASLIENRPLESITLENDTARRDREAVAKIADVVLEVLISSREVTVQEVSGDKTYKVPDIQATAIRLRDAKVIAQASASDVMNKAGGAASVARNFGVQDITEATSLALMEDMAQEGK